MIKFSFLSNKCVGENTYLISIKYACFFPDSQQFCHKNCLAAMFLSKNKLKLSHQSCRAAMKKYKNQIKIKIKAKFISVYNAIKSLDETI